MSAGGATMGEANRRRLLDMTNELGTRDPAER